MSIGLNLFRLSLIPVGYFLVYPLLSSRIPVLNLDKVYTQIDKSGSLKDQSHKQDPVAQTGDWNESGDNPRPIRMKNMIVTQSAIPNGEGLYQLELGLETNPEYRTTLVCDCTPWRNAPLYNKILSLLPGEILDDVYTQGGYINGFDRRLTFTPGRDAYQNSKKLE